MQADSDRLLDLVFSCAATCVPLWWGGWPPQRHLHRRRLRGHVPPIIENRTCIYHFLPPFPQYFGLPTQYFCQVYASGHLQKVSVQIETPFCILWRAFIKAEVPSTMEPLDLFRADGKRLYGATLVLWSQGRYLAWDAKLCTRAPSQPHT